ncbi:MAG TPA: hypothetical protein DCO75_03750 [Fibrobacteres bacterium]|jgi:hypothetical protein|nr:hypothetical protein [Fibrobacterota bacterium]
MKKSLKRQKTSDKTEPVFTVIKGGMAPVSTRSVDEINTWIEQDYMLFYDKYRKPASKDAHTFVKFILK